MQAVTSSTLNTEYRDIRARTTTRYSEIRVFRIEEQQHNIRTSSSFQMQRDYH